MDMRQSINDIEACADDAKQAMASAKPSDQLRDAVEQLHQRARDAKRSASEDENAMRKSIAPLEEAADRAMEAWRASNMAEPKLQQALQKAHAEASKLKREAEHAA